MDQNPATFLQRLFDKRNDSRKVLDDIIICDIIDLDIAMLVVLPSLRLLVVKPQRRDNMRYACLFEGRWTPESKDPGPRLIEDADRGE